MQICYFTYLHLFVSSIENRGVGIESGIEAIFHGPFSRKYAEAYDVTFSHLHKGLENLELIHLGKEMLEGDHILHIALRVDDLNAMTEKLKSRGVAFDPSYPKTAAFGGGLTAKFSGPEGEKIESVDRKALQEI